MKTPISSSYYYIRAQIIQRSWVKKTIPIKKIHMGSSVVEVIVVVEIVEKELIVRIVI